MAEITTTPRWDVDSLTVGTTPAKPATVRAGKRPTRNPKGEHPHEAHPHHHPRPRVPHAGGCDRRQGGRAGPRSRGRRSCRRGQEGEEGQEGQEGREGGRGCPRRREGR